MGRDALPMSLSRHDRRALVLVALVAPVVCGVIVLAGPDESKPASASPAVTGFVVVEPVVVEPALVNPGLPDAAVQVAAVGGAPTTTPTPGTTVLGQSDTGAATGDGTVPDLAGAAPGSATDCTLTVRALGVGDSGDGVTCLQNALKEAGYFSGTVTGTYEQTTYAAVKALQTKENLFVDGKVGRESALFLGIWPEEESLVVRTPAPSPGATDSLGYELSSVATAGSDAPPLPADSGSGRRVVYSRAGQRVWAVGKDGSVIRSWLVTGSRFNNEQPGTHQVYSKSETSTAWNGKAVLPLIIRYQKTKIGAIAFHGIPRHIEDGSAYQTDKELGSRLSGGCQRQANLDARFLWDFADVGTTVVVI